MNERDDVPPYVRLSIGFGNGHRLAYIAQRKLGRIALAENVDAFIEQRNLGPDALDVDLQAFRGCVSGRGGTVKGWLIDQTVFVGIGNIYSDETLFQARIHPRRKVTGLKDEKVKCLFREMASVLRCAIRAGEHRAEMPCSFLIGHRGAGETCPRCGGRVASIAVSGRSRYYCPDCQATEP